MGIILVVHPLPHKTLYCRPETDDQTRGYQNRSAPCCAIVYVFQYPHDVTFLSPSFFLTFQPFEQSIFRFSFAFALIFFAGVDTEATNRVREYIVGYPPSSPSIALFKDGSPVHVLERHQIEGRSPQEIAFDLVTAFDQFCE